MLRRRPALFGFHSAFLTPLVILFVSPCTVLNIASTSTHEQHHNKETMDDQYETNHTNFHLGSSRDAAPGAGNGAAQPSPMMQQVRSQVAAPAPAQMQQLQPSFGIMGQHSIGTFGQQQVYQAAIADDLIKVIGDPPKKPNRSEFFALERAELSKHIVDPLQVNQIVMANWEAEMKQYKQDYDKYTTKLERAVTARHYWHDQELSRAGAHASNIGAQQFVMSMVQTSQPLTQVPVALTQQALANGHNETTWNTPLNAWTCNSVGSKECGDTPNTDADKIQKEIEKKVNERTGAITSKVEALQDKMYTQLDTMQTNINAQSKSISKLTSELASVLMEVSQLKLLLEERDTGIQAKLDLILVHFTQHPTLQGQEVCQTGQAQQSTLS